MCIFSFSLSFISAVGKFFEVVSKFLKPLLIDNHAPDVFPGRQIPDTLVYLLQAISPGDELFQTYLPVLYSASKVTKSRLSPEPQMQPGIFSQ